MPNYNEQFARSGAFFTMELFNQIAAADGLKENIIFSPFSVQACLALAFAGAQGETADEIANVMKYVSNNQSEVAQTFKFVLGKYKTSPLLKIANKAYIKEGYKTKDSYQRTLKENYDAEAEEINFVDSRNSANAINAWVESKTNGKIKDLISSDCLDESTRLVLLNALHFKGNWKSKFDEKKTEEGDFWIREEESIKIQYMYQKAKFQYGYFPDLDCTAIDMPYKDSDLSMFVILPAEREGLRNLAQKLNLVDIVGLAENMFEEEIEVTIPKFKIDFSIELNKTLSELGLKRVFENPDFSNMLDSDERLVVSNIVHKACIEVNEEGTEAAAATGMIMMMKCLLMPMQFNADHPFLYMIWNKKNILFAGAFVDAPKD